MAWCWCAATPPRLRGCPVADLLWDQLLDESARAYACFLVYRDLGPDRSLDKAFTRAQEAQEGTRKAPGCWHQWSGKYRWPERAQAWDAAMRAKEQAAREAAQAAEAQAWARKRAEEAAVEWDLSRALIEKARAMLAFPLQTQEIYQEEEKRTVIIKPARWTFRDITAAVETASKLARLAAGMETDRIGLRVARQIIEEVAQSSGLPADAVQAEYEMLARLLAP